MVSSIENLYWDNEDERSQPTASVGTVHPGLTFSNHSGLIDIRIYYCYYQPELSGDSIFG